MELSKTIQSKGRLSRVAILLLGIEVAAGTAALSQTPQIIRVDCTRNRSVQRAIDSRISPLIVEITGICQEDVIIDRDDITLRGLDPNYDGLRGLAADPGGDHAVILVRGGSRVRIENLRVVDGSRFGLNSRGADLTVVNSKFLGNARAGISYGGPAFIDATDVEISGGLRGLQVFESGLVLCHGCDISASTFALLVVGARGFADQGSTLNGGIVALSASSNAAAGATDSTLIGGEYALTAENGAQVHAVGSDLDGSILSRRDSVVDIQNSTQLADPLGGNVVDTGSTLRITAAATVLGPVDLVDFSHLTLDAGSTISGNLTCSSGSDAYCANPNQVSGVIAACARCIKP